MCRYAGDLMPMFKILTGEKKAKELKLEEPVDVRKLKVYYMVDDGGSPITTRVHPDLIDSQKRLVQRLEDNLGIKCKKVNIREFFFSAMIWSHKMSSDPTAKSFSQEMVEGEGDLNPLIELLKWCCFKASDHTLPAILLGLMDKFVTPNDPRHPIFLRKCEDLQNELEELLGDDGVLLYQSHPTPAPYHGLPLLRPFNFSYTGIFNVTGNPVTQVPLGLGSWGVPLGIQILGAKNRDRNTLALALEVEKLFGGWIPPTGVQ